MGCSKVERMYGPVDKPSDIRKINDKIRAQMRKMSPKRRDYITELLRRSHYLVTLTYGPGFGKKLRGKLLTTRRVAKQEYSKTARLANLFIARGDLRGPYYDELWGPGRIELGRRVK